MLVAFSILLFLIISMAVVWEYKKTEENHKLIAIPLTAYFFFGMYFLERTNIHEALFYILTLFMLVLSFRFAYIEVKNCNE